MESPLPPYHPLASDSDLYYNSRNGGDYLSTTPVGENTPLVSRPDPKSKREPYLSYYSLAAIFIFFLILVPLSGLCGAWIQRSIQVSRDILDPKVRDQIRREWRIELETHNRAIERAQAEEREWQEKKENREHEEAERAEREKRKRDLMGLYWDDAQGEHCIAYRTRKYRARLENLLPSINAIEACKATPITIHSLTYDSPLYCEDTSTIFGGPSIYGHWVVHDDPFCSTFWQSFTDHNCTAPGSGLRRVALQLGALRSGDDGAEMSLSTPAFLYGQSFDGPMSYEYSFLWGHWGIWNVPDDTCM